MKQTKIKEYIEKEEWDICGLNETKLNERKGKYI